MDRTSPLTRDEAILLWKLDAELEGMRHLIQSARTIGSFPRRVECRHPILALAFTRLPVGVIEPLLLRLSEAVDPYLHRASLQVLGEPVVEKRGRDWHAIDPVLDLLLDLRHYRVAHLVRLRTQADVAFERMKSEYGDAYSFLEVAIDHIDQLIDELDANGLFDPREGLTHSYSTIGPITSEDLGALLDAANAISDAKRTPA